LQQEFTELERRYRERTAELERANERLRAEAGERGRAEAALRESEARLRTLTAALPHIVWEAGPDGLPEYYNRRWYEYTGLTVEDSLGHGWTTPLHPEDRAPTLRRWQESVATGTPYQIDYRLRGADGVYRWFYGLALPHRDAVGRIVKWFGTCTDIDDRKRTREDLEERVRERTRELTEANAALQAEIEERKRLEAKAEVSAAELQRSNRELEEFASVASHDLQEPLRKIQTFGDRLQSKCAADLGEQGREFLERMLSSAARMRSLIDDLLTYSRISTRTLPFTAVDLNVVTREVVSDLEGRLHQTGGRVEAGSLPTLEADALQMRQLLQNLVSNGLKFHRPGEPPVVRVEAEVLPGDEGEAGPRVRLAVGDNGIGFEEVYLDRIFTMFQRLHGRTEYDGTGVGLAICRKIVERHHGHITARSAPGQGATFLVTLPLRQQKEAERGP
jgi:PAS domain S-box-containing protein